MSKPLPFEGIKTKNIWSGSLHETNSSIALNEPLEKGSLYIFTFYGISANYLHQQVFTYINNYFQTSYYDGSTVMRIRLDISNNGKTITVNSASMNNANNTALISIEKII